MSNCCDMGDDMVGQHVKATWWCGVELNKPVPRLVVRDVFASCLLPTSGAQNNQSLYACLVLQLQNIQFCVYVDLQTVSPSKTPSFYAAL